MLLFPRYVFNGKATQIVSSREEYDSALDMGWFSTLGEAAIAPEPEVAPPVEVVEPPVDAPPTRGELEMKARDLGIKFHPNIGDKKLAHLITVSLGG